MERVAIILAPGTNCHEESKYAIEAVEQQSLQGIIVPVSDFFEQRDDILEYDGVYAAGGFGRGDHLGAGRIDGKTLSRFLKAFAATGRPMLGVCNGFQIFNEAGLFDGPEGKPGGALVVNRSGKFENCRVMLRAEQGSPWTEDFAGAYLYMPSAHGEGRWRIPNTGAKHLTPIFRYTRDGVPTEAYPDNPNGTRNGVAGLANKNVAGMMPHPERAIRLETGSTSGRLIFGTFARMIRETW